MGSTQKVYQKLLEMGGDVEMVGGMMCFFSSNCFPSSVALAVDTLLCAVHLSLPLSDLSCFSVGLEWLFSTLFLVLGKELPATFDHIDSPLKKLMTNTPCLRRS